MDDPRKRSIAMLNYITGKSLTHKMKRKKYDCYQKKTASKRKPQRNTLYLPSDVRDEVERIAVEISYRRGRRISDSGFVQYLIKTCSQKAIDELINGADIDSED